MDDKDSKDNPKPNSRRRFEYFVASSIDLPAHQANVFHAALNKIASEGWRLATIHQGLFIFEREV